MKYTIFVVTESVEHTFKALLIIPQTTLWYCSTTSSITYPLYGLKSIDYYENHDVVFRYRLHDAQTNAKTTRCTIAVTHAVIQSGADGTADGRRKNIIKGHS